MVKEITAFFLGLLTAISGITHQGIANSSQSSSQPQTAVTQQQLTLQGGTKYKDGNLPLGDGKYSTSPKKGYIYLCNARKDPQGGGAGVDGPWIHGQTWNINEKIAVTGKNVWSNAIFSNRTSGTSRTLSGNDLPNHTTGTFPIQSSDKAYQYDRNPNKISPQTFSLSLPTDPTYQDTPNCMGGEVGVMLSGVALFNGFDATLRDAAAHEVQDSCQGHPQVSGEYHYHSLSSCINNVSISTVIGYALDGFPITGPNVSTDKYLTTDDLDECHGIVSEITIDNTKKTMYHYVMTEDFPYSVGCFRGKPVQLQVVEGKMNQSTSSQGMQNVNPTTQGKGQPPQAAITACSNKTAGTTCQFSTPKGVITGTCQLPPNTTTTVCVPQGR